MACGNKFRATHIEGVRGRIDTEEELRLALREKSWRGILIQGLDLAPYAKELMEIEIRQCIFLGCSLPPLLTRHLSVHNDLFGDMDVPYEVFRPIPYTRETLYGGFDPGYPDSYEHTYDRKVYKHFEACGHSLTNAHEVLARTLHDFSMRITMNEILLDYDERDVVAVMGGHKVGRNERTYRDICKISKALTEAGKLMVSGGGPGAMEAAHLGAWFAGKETHLLDEAIAHLATAPSYTHPRWLATAFEVIGRYPESKYRSLSIPTWVYGHEPPTPFASDICKLFENSLREEGLLAIAVGGIVFAPGSAGTMQEIFQDLAQNHYRSYGTSSPMVFLDKDFWTETIPLYPLLQRMQEQGRIGDHVALSISDDAEEIVDFLLRARKKIPVISCTVRK